MELCNFTSLFEIFCTIYLAYVITDNYSESNFIATITEKIDLIEMGLTWNSEVKKNKNFQDLVAQMKYRM